MEQIETHGATRVSSNEGVVLGMLARGSGTGATLLRRMRRTVGFFWAPARSHVYELLPRLVARGYVTRRRVVRDDETDAEVFEITGAGEEALRGWLSAPALAEEAGRNPFLVKVFFGGQLGRDGIASHVRARRAAVAAELCELEEIDARLAPQDDLYGWLALRYGLERDRATLRWADEALALLEASGP